MEAGRCPVLSVLRTYRLISASCQGVKEEKATMCVSGPVPKGSIASLRPKGKIAMKDQDQESPRGVTCC